VADGKPGTLANKLLKNSTFRDFKNVFFAGAAHRALALRPPAQLAPPLRKGNQHEHP
jgi:hypothetical protein